MEISDGVKLAPPSKTWPTGKVTSKGGGSGHAMGVGKVGDVVFDGTGCGNK